MLDVLLVDDEQVARESLKYLIDWEPLGFRIAGEAEDGRQALERLQHHRYGLVLTDIRMPTMNGLDMIARLREFSDVPVVILSGYEDFEYAREGIKMGVHDYLLKPVDEEELAALLRRIGSQIAERARHEKRHSLGMNALRDQSLRKWCRGPLSEREYADLEQWIGWPPEAGSFRCLLVEMMFVYGHSEHLSERDIELKRFAVRNILEELCGGERGFVFEESEDRYGVALFDADEEAAEEAARRMAASVASFAKETVTIGIGAPVTGRRELYRSLADAEDALDGKFLQGEGCVLRSMASSAGGAADAAGRREAQEDVLAAMRGYLRERVPPALERLWETLRESGADPGEIRASVLQVLVQVYQWVKTTGADPGRAFGHEFGDYERVMKARTMEELFAFVEAKCLSVLELMQESRELQPNKAVGAVQRIVQEQYAGSVSLRSVAEQVYLNPNYLGKLFKATTEMSFNDYVLKVRMEKAQELLLHTDKKVYEVAQEVGYAELDWFYKRFKAYTGVSAGEFRSQSGG